MKTTPEEAKLPEKPSLEQLRKLAKELKASESLPTLSDAQHELARRYGFPSWPKLKLSVEQATLRRLIQEGAAGPVLAYLKGNPALARTPFPAGDTPLHLAAEENRPEIVEALVSMGASMSSRYEHSAHSPLSWALTNWSFEAARKLVELGTEPDLFCAAGLGDLERVRAFWKDGKLAPRASSTGSSRMTESWERLPCPPEDPMDQVGDALYIACRADRFEAAKFLLEQGADPNFRGYIGGTCLHWAEFSQNPVLSELVREFGGSEELRDYAFKATPRLFPLFVFAGWGFARKLAELLAREPALAAAETEIGTPLHAAASGGNEACVRLLLAAGAEKTRRNAAGKTALDVALEKGHSAVAELLR